MLNEVGVSQAANGDSGCWNVWWGSPVSSNHNADDVDALYDLAHGRHFICFSPFNPHNDCFQIVVWGSK